VECIQLFFNLLKQTSGNFTATLTVRNTNGKCSISTKVLIRSHIDSMILRQLIVGSLSFQVTTWVASPTVTITSPPDKTLYNAGDNIAPKAVHSPGLRSWCLLYATPPSQGLDKTGTTLYWDLQLWHNSHFHPAFEYSNGMWLTMHRLYISVSILWFRETSRNTSIPIGRGHYSRSGSLQLSSGLHSHWQHEEYRTSSSNMHSTIK